MSIQRTYDYSPDPIQCLALSTWHTARLSGRRADDFSVPEGNLIVFNETLDGVREILHSSQSIDRRARHWFHRKCKWSMDIATRHGAHYLKSARIKKICSMIFLIFFTLFFRNCSFSHGETRCWSWKHWLGSGGTSSCFLVTHTVRCDTT